MNHLIVIGAGTGGTIVANRMRGRLGADWEISVVDPSPAHLYQPGLLFLPFGARDEEALQRQRRSTLSTGVRWIQQDLVALDPVARTVRLGGGALLSYDLLVLATGARVRPDLVTGLEDAISRGRAHGFYALEDALVLRERLDAFTRGRLVLNVAELPIKCPVAPLEFLLLADAFFRKKGVRDQVELVYATPLDGAFTRPIASRMLGELLEARQIKVEPNFALERVDADRRALVSYDEREIPYDLLVEIPTHSGAAFVEDTGLGNELAFIATDPRTLAVKNQERIFALGDCTDAPASKAGSVAHFQADALEENLLRAIDGQPPRPLFDGHANCFVESGGGKAMLIDFNYDVEPLPGRFPTAAGPFSLLRESRLNHFGKLAFRPLYWNALLKGRHLPVSAQLSMSGKERPVEQPSL